MRVRYLAHLIANSSFVDPKLSRLTAPESDVTHFGDLLENEEYGGYCVTRSINKRSHEVRQDLEGFFATAEPNDVLLLYVSTHGAKDERGHLYFAAAETTLQKLLTTSVEAALINKLSQSSRARRQLFIFDSCYSGAYSREFQSKATSRIEAVDFLGGDEARPSDTRRLIIFTSSTSVELSWQTAGPRTGVELELSVFTRHLIEGIESGAADKDRDGYFGANELFQYAAQATSTEHPGQSPQIFIPNGMSSGDLVVARNPRVVEATLPEKIKFLLHANAGPEARVEAMQELWRLAVGTDERLSEVAQRVLKGFAQDDHENPIWRSAAATITSEIEKRRSSPVGMIDQLATENRIASLTRQWIQQVKGSPRTRQTGERVRIALLNNPRFDARRERKDLWNRVVGFVNEQVHADVFVVTGELTKSRSSDDVRLAKEGLSRLIVHSAPSGFPRLLLAPRVDANHERPWWYPRSSWLQLERRYEQALRTCFDGVLLDRPVDLSLRSGTLAWLVRIQSLNGTSKPSQLHEQTRGGALFCDLQIGVLQEPIARNLKSLLLSNVDILVSVVEEDFSESTYTIAARDSTSKVVVSGSVTGALKSPEALRWDSVAFNVLELTSSQSVLSSRALVHDGNLSLKEDGVLLAQDEVRRARYLRRRDPRLGPPRSKLDVLYIVERDGQATIMHTYTDYLIGSAWSLDVRGKPGSLGGATALVTFEWADGEEGSFETPFVESAEDPGLYVCGIPLPSKHCPLALRITALWRWKNIVVSREGLQNLAECEKSEFHLACREAICVETQRLDEFESLTLTLQMPIGFFPKREDFAVYVQSNWKGPIEVADALTERLQSGGPERMVMNISYPIADHNYYLSWVLPDSIRSSTGA